jgi:hypothetical protein
MISDTTFYVYFTTFAVDERTALCNNSVNEISVWPENGHVWPKHVETIVKEEN